MFNLRKLTDADLIKLGGAQWPFSPSAAAEIPSDPRMWGGAFLCHLLAERLDSLSGGRGDPTNYVMSDVYRERVRQIEAEGWTPEHDDEHDAGQMVAAACTYALEATFDGPKARGTWFHTLWPWDLKWWKPKDKRRDLVRAAALIVAEIERLDRAAKRRNAAS